MFCTVCRKQFEPWVNTGGYTIRDRCETCEPLHRDNKIKYSDRDTYCIDCGAVLTKYLQTSKSGLKWYTSVLKRRCDVCNENHYAIVNSPKPRVCIICGRNHNGKGFRYCDNCREKAKGKFNSLANLRSSVKWAKNNPQKAKVQSLAKYHRHKVNVIYECACDHPKKHMHHFDYDRPYDVLLLCPACHSTEHRRLKRLEEQSGFTGEGRYPRPSGSPEVGKRSTRPVLSPGPN